MQVYQTVSVDNKVYVLASIILNKFNQIGRKINTNKESSHLFYEIYNTLLYLGMTKQEIDKYLTYYIKIDGKGDMLTILPTNIVCALWFINIFPDDLDFIAKNNEYVDEIDYRTTWVYDPKTQTINKKESD